jgi:hypothetical protein
MFQEKPALAAGFLLPGIPCWRGISRGSAGATRAGNNARNWPGSPPFSSLFSTYPHQLAPVGTGKTPAVARSYPALWENKCLGAKAWREVESKGLAVAKPVYAAQVALYQAHLELHEHPAIFTAINADSMEIYVERVPFNAALAQQMTDRAVRVITATEAGELLPRRFFDATHFECRMCAWQDRCWRAAA